MPHNKQHYQCVRQHDSTDCGPACLATIGKQYGLNISLTKVRLIAGTDKYGTSMLGLVKTAEKLGFEAKGVKGDRAAFKSGFPVPAIAHIVVNGNLLHYVVVEEVNDNKIIISDPAKGIIAYKPEEFFDMWSGTLMLIHPGKNFSKGNFRTSPFRFFLNLILEQKKLIFPVFFLSILVTALGISGTFYYRFIMDVVVQNGLYHELNTVSLGIIFLYVLMQLISFARGQLIIHLSNKLDTALVLKSYIHVTNLPMDFFEYRKTGEIISRFTDASQVRDAISQSTITVLIDGVMAIVGGIMLYMESPFLLGIASILLGIYAIITFTYIRPRKKNSEKVMKDNSQFTAHVIESINGEETIKSLNAETDFEKKADHLFCNLLSSVYHSSTLSNTQVSLTGGAAFIGEVIILWAGTTMTLNGSMTMGKLMTFVALLSYFLSPLQNIIDLQPQLQTALVSIERLLDILDLQTESAREDASVSILGKDITLSHINFRYGSRKLVLRDISLQIKTGERIAIVGESGCGKTTLVKLLMRFFEYESGTIYIGNDELRSISAQSIRKQIAYVSQNIFLFSGSIRENLEMGIGKVSDQELDHVCELCSIKPYIDSLPLGYDSSVGENGDSLSGGQKQRLAIARAILRRPSVLILDEATSNLDSIAENAIHKVLTNLPSSVTVITIAHRLSTIKDCDRIVVMENGMIAEQGTHEELLQKHAAYFRLWNINEPN